MTSKPRGARAAALGLCAILTGAAAARAEVVVTAGRSVSLMTLSSIDQVCHWQGPVTVNVIEPPRGGFLEILRVKAYPNFNALNTRSRCNTLKLPATQVVYQSAGNFLGTDFVTVEAIFPDGNLRRIRVPVSVRPVTPGEAMLPGGGADANAPVPAQDSVPVEPARPNPVVRHARKAPSTMQAAHRRHCQGRCVDVGGAAPPAHPTDPAPVVKTPLVNI